uniref:Uncharacterized protein n=1 Tax=Scytodes thoracica TaxID=1112478 RepID=A0A0A0V6Q9_SCYTH|nr:hypothetical protein [Scytodes thoracica]
MMHIIHDIFMLQKEKKIKQDSISKSELGKQILYIYPRHKYLIL